ncbi:MAG: type II secretion system F family protein [Candidatus Thermoplasmatota archaeon]|nr:type II secretion system F family protein [Candidatus Thermoplasmatota archaeon]MBS3801937.1 type II secretion system F family protein [Candidatus Thermoplasmatota archaeon]
MNKIPQQNIIKKMILSGNLNRVIVYSISGTLVTIFIILGLLSLLNIVSFSFADSTDFFVFAILSITGIYGMYEYVHFSIIRKIDSIFPDFVRDLASSRRAGMTFTKAILFTSRGSYGLLTKEIKKIAQQISWGSSVEEALTDFAKRINTTSVRRTISLIIEAGRSGGNVADVLDVAAKDALEIKQLEKERRVNMLSYVVVIYVAMFVFMAIIAILAGVFIPTITGSEAKGLSQAMGSGFINQGEILQIFYFATLAQSIGTGVVAGIFEDGHFQSSVKHVFILCFISWMVFKFIGTI